LIFLTVAQILRMQAANIKKFGGAHGVREMGVLQSALEAPENRAYYEEADVVKCAATYGFHLCQAHAFVDGNKRVAAAAMLIFLHLNGQQHSLTVDEVIDIFLRVASSEMTRDELEAFIRERI
jgi:death-on-curing protein